MHSHLALGIAACAALLLSLTLPSPASAVVLADLSDPVGDDSGPGSYAYPANGVFTPGCFDLTRVVAHDLGSTVRFEFTIAGTLTNPFASESGFSLQSIDLYVDLDSAPGTGAFWTPDGRHADFSSEAGWERCVWLAPTFDSFESGVFRADGTYVTGGVSVSVNASTRTIALTAPKSIFPGISASTRYLALMLGQDGYSSGRVRPVEAAQGEWTFGGGASGTSDSNVIDLAGVAGLSQQGLLAAFDPGSGVRPVLFFTPDTVAPAIAHAPPAAVVRSAPSLEATVTDRVVASAVLYARRTGTAAFDSTVLARASIPAPGQFVFRGAPSGASVGGSSIEYYFRASDGLRATRLPAGTGVFTAPVDSITPPPPPRKLDVIFLFHSNQNLVPYAKVGDEACYLGLLDVLRRHPQSRFMLHWSGTLLHSLAWMRPASLAPLREGIADGQFEIVGSTYAQNIMYSTRIDTTDTEMNRRQIREHRRLLRSLLGVEPLSFWNCERVWTQSFVSLLREEGYRYGQIEDYAVERSGAAASEYVLRTTRRGQDTLVVFNDDKQFQGLVNGAIDSGDDSALLAFLEALYQEDTGDRYAVCYHEDAEATGLWDYEGGGDPDANRAHLDALLTHLEARPWIRVTTYGEFAASHAPSEDVTPVADAAADWMGRDAWFATNESANFDAYRALFDAVRDTLGAVEEAIAAHPGADSASVRLHEHAWWTLSAHQYEFGCAGTENTTNSAPLDLCRAALVPALAARLALDPLAARPPFAGDFDEDGVSEYGLTGAGWFAVISSRGAQLFYLFDLIRGAQIVGPDNFYYYGETYTSNARYVPKLQGGVDVYPWLAGKPEIGDLFASTYEVRRRAFLDVLDVPTGTQYLRDHAFALSADAVSVTASAFAGGVSIAKRFSLGAGGLHVEYTLAPSSGSVSGTLAIENALSPDHREAVDGGRATLCYLDGADTSATAGPSTVGVLNRATGRLARLTFSPAATLSGEEVLFALELDGTFAFTASATNPFLLQAYLAMSLPTLAVQTPHVPAARLVAAPVPASSEVTLSFAPFEAPCRGALRVFDLRGRLVRTLAAGDLRGSYRWDLKDARGARVAAGIYFARAETSRGAARARIAVAP